MGGIGNTILEYLLKYISQYSFLIDLSYYGKLFSEYFSAEGFFCGLILVLLIYFGRLEDEMVPGFCKTLLMVALINCSSVISDYLNAAFGQGLAEGSARAILNTPDNLISGFVLTAVLLACYQGHKGRAFLLGLGVYMTIPLLKLTEAMEAFDDVTEMADMTEMDLCIFLAHLLLIGFFCIGISTRKHFFTAWIWYFVYHVAMQVLTYTLPLILNAIAKQEYFEYEYSYTLAGALDFASAFILDGVIFVSILVFAIIFEKGVLTVKGPAAT